jgi:AAHS family 4-hydroxybenzoate transporter-like MFS transporter
VKTPPISNAGPVDVGRLLDEGDWTGYQRWLVALTALTIVFDGADNQLLGAAVPAMMRDWSVARAVFAPVLAVGLIGMTIGGAIAGIAGDRIGRKRALVASVVLFGLATAAISLVQGVAALGALRFVAGLGLGGALPNAAALASEFVPRRHRPFAVTLTIVCVPLGGTLAGLLALRVLPVLGWRALFLVGGLIPIAIGVVLTWLLAESPRYLATRPAHAGDLRSLLARMGHRMPDGTTFVDSLEPSVGRPGVRALLRPEFRRDTVALWCAFFSCLLAVYLGFNWIPAMITGAGLPPTVGSSGIMIYNLGGVAGAIAGALTFNRLGSRPTMLTLAMMGAVSAVGMRWVPITADSDTLPLMVMLAVNGGMTNAVQTTLYALAAQVYPTAIRSTGVGAALAIGRGGAILSTYAGAWALDAGGPTAFFILVAAAMSSVFVALAVVKRHIQPVLVVTAVPQEAR